VGGELEVEAIGPRQGMGTSMPGSFVPRAGTLFVLLQVIIKRRINEKTNKKACFSFLSGKVFLVHVLRVLVLFVMIPLYRF